MRRAAISVKIESATLSRCDFDAQLRQAEFIRPIALIARGDALSRDQVVSCRKLELKLQNSLLFTTDLSQRRAK